MRPRDVAILILVLAGAAGLTSGVRAEDAPEDPAARKKRADQARKDAADAERKFLERVNVAIDRGTEWLRKQQNDDGLFPFVKESDRQNYGRLSLALLTLVKCGLHEKDKEIERGLRALRKMYDTPEHPGWDVKSKGEQMTYASSVMLLFLDALYNPPPAKKDSRYAAPSKKSCKYPKDIERLIREIVDWIVTKQEETIWRYPGGLGSGEKQDLSNTQYALLALQAAGRCNIEAPASTYRKVLEYLLASQEQDGPEEPRWIENPAYEPGGEDRYGPWLPAGKVKARGWGYYVRPGVPTTGSMTTAGVAALAIVKERLQALNQLDKETSGKIDRSMLGGLAWLSHNFDATQNPGQGGWHYYYLYGLERVGAFTGLKHFGKHDWYREGAEVLLGQQSADGGWPQPSSGELSVYEPRLEQTCFALLFLKRATIPPAIPLGPVVTGD